MTINAVNFHNIKLESCTTSKQEDISVSWVNRLSVFYTSCWLNVMSRLQPVLSQFPVFMHYWWGWYHTVVCSLLSMLTCSFTDAHYNQTKPLSFIHILFYVRFFLENLYNNRVSSEWICPLRQRQEAQRNQNKTCEFKWLKTGSLTGCDTQYTGVKGKHTQVLCFEYMRFCSSFIMLWQ